MLAQIGEFSFLLSVVGANAGVISGEDHRLVVAVAALSLALSPLWVITGRRVHGLAQEGITSGSQILKLVYGRETEFVAETFDKASSKTLWAVRNAARWIGEQRQKRVGRPAAASRDAAEKAPGIEIIPPAQADAAASRGNGKDKPGAAPPSRPDRPAGPSKSDA
jgi:hypothetical protein